MDAGLAAVLGAAVGALATVGAALPVWTRERREDEAQRRKELREVLQQISDVLAGQV